MLAYFDHVAIASSFLREKIFPEMALMQILLKAEAIALRKHGKSNGPHVYVVYTAIPWSCARKRTLLQLVSQWIVDLQNNPPSIFFSTLEEKHHSKCTRQN